MNPLIRPVSPSQQPALPSQDEEFQTEWPEDNEETAFYPEAPRSPEYIQSFGNSTIPGGYPSYVQIEQHLDTIKGTLELLLDLAEAERDFYLYGAIDTMTLTIDHLALGVAATLNKMEGVDDRQPVS